MEEKKKKKEKKVRHPVLETVELACKNKQPRTIKKQNENLKLLKEFDRVNQEKSKILPIGDYIHMHHKVADFFINSVAKELKTEPHSSAKIKSSSGLITIQDLFSRQGEEESTAKEVDIMLKRRAKLIKMSKKGFFEMFGISHSSHSYRVRKNIEPSREVCVKAIVSLKSDADTSELFYRKLGYAFKGHVEFDNLIMIGLDRYHHLEYDEYIEEFEKFINEYGYTFFTNTMKLG